MKTPRLRTVILTVFGVPLLTFCIWSAWALRWAYTATPGSPAGQGAALQAFVEEQQAGLPPGGNAWPLLIDLGDSLAAAVEAHNASLGVAPADWPDGYSWPPEVDDAGRATLAPGPERLLRAHVAALREAGVFDRNDALRDKPRFVRPVTEDFLLLITIPELGRCRAIARTNRAAMRFANADGDDGELLRGFENNLAVARALSWQATIIDRLVSHAIIALTLEELRHAMLERELPEATLRGGLAAMDRQLAALPPITLQIEGERRSALNFIQVTHTDDGRGDGRFLQRAANRYVASPGSANPIPGASASPLSNLAGFVLPSKKESTRVINEFYDKVTAQAALPRDQRSGGFNPDLWVEQLPRVHVIPRLILPALSRFQAAGDTCRMEINATRLMVAIELHRRAAGGPPASLADLAPGTIVSIPADPYSAAGFGYRRFAPGEDASGRAYVLYSFGADGVDNGGAPDPENPHAALTNRGKDRDFVLNAPRRAERR